MINGELIVDNFAGGGGTSTGCEMATGYSPDIAINHDPEAIRLHKVNHPNTRHYTESVWDINPIEVCKGHPVALCWLSPDCYNAQGFPPDYIIDHDIEGNSYSRTEQVKRCGNAVPPPFAEALIKANLPELCISERRGSKRIDYSESQLRFA